MSELFACTLLPEEASNCPNAVPVFDLKIAAGDFSKEQWLQDCRFTAKSGFFLTQAIDESMNRRIPNGSGYLFREPSDGSRNANVVIVQSRGGLLVSSQYPPRTRFNGFHFQAPNP